MRRRIALIVSAAVAMLSVVVLGGEAQAADYGVNASTGDFELQNTSSDGIPLDAGISVKCKVQARWVTNNQTDLSHPVQYLEYVYGCATGWNISDAVVNFTAYNGDKTKSVGVAFNKQVDGMDGNNVAGFSPAAPFAVTQLCWTGTVKAHTGGSSAVSGCTPLLVSPPAVTSPVTGGCARADLVEPYVTAPKAVSVSGGWAWQQKVTLRLANKQDAATAPALIDGMKGYLWGFVRVDVQAIPTSNNTFWTYDAGGATQNSTGVSPSDTSAVGVSFDNGFNPSTGSPVASPALTTITLTVNSKTLTTAVGTGSPLTPVLGAGYGAMPSSANSAAVGWQAGTSLPFTSIASGTDTPGWWHDNNTNVSSTFRNAGKYVGHTRAAWCYAWWGDNGTVKNDTSGYGSTVGPVAPGTSDTPPPVSGGGAPAAFDPSGPTPPEGAGDCAGFSFTDPTTWAGAGICVLVKTIVQLGKAIAGIADVLGKLLVNLGQLLQDLLVPDPSSWGIDGLKAQLEAKPPFSVLAALGSGVTAAATAYNTSGNGCGVLAGFGQIVPGGSATQITCTAIKSGSGYAGLYTLVELGLFLMTGLGVFVLLAGAIRKGEG